MLIFVQTLAILLDIYFSNSVFMNKIKSIQTSVRPRLLNSMNSTNMLTTLNDPLVWKLTSNDIITFVVVNIGTLAAIWIILRCIWKPPKPQSSNTEDQNLLEEEKESSNNGLREIHEGEVAGDYSEDWTKTFDFIFVIIMIVFLGCNIAVTAVTNPSLWENWIFWLKNIAISLSMNLTFLVGGLICRHFCAIDTHGYIITNRHSKFKVNYTKKVHHFAAHMLPLLIVKTDLGANKNVPASLDLMWHYWFAMFSTLVLIKPLRERCKILMIQFNAMDRPEDRPYTMLWTIAYNNIPGYALTIFFRWLYPRTGVHVDLATIVSLINTVGDGLAEPIGIYFGKHRYKTRGCCNKTAYERSFEGSSCVFMASMVATTIFWHALRTRLQFWFTIMVLPIIMAITEALSPHTVDSCFIHGIGGITLLITSHISTVFS